MATGDRFDREAKILIARQVLENGRSAAEVSEEFSLSENTVRKWVRQYKGDRENAFPGSGHKQSRGQKWMN